MLCCLASGKFRTSGAKESEYETSTLQPEQAFCRHAASLKRENMRHMMGVIWLNHIATKKNT